MKKGDIAMMTVYFQGRNLTVQRKDVVCLIVDVRYKYWDEQMSEYIIEYRHPVSKEKTHQLVLGRELRKIGGKRS